ncbi:MAG: MFS transporter, partial [Acidobacteriota bacterium]|nr:MFS transporter [Acidobacteriota bacterium]
MKIPHIRWVIAGMLFLATAINYTDRGALSIVSSEIRTEFHMTEQDYSWVLFFFMLAYAIMYAGSGYIVDRLGTKRGFALFISFWSVAAMLHGFARGLWSLILCRFLLGLGEPGNWPAAAKAVGEWFPARQRALGVGIFNAGSSLGSGLAGPVIATLTVMFGWRAAFVFTGLIGLAWLVGWLLLYDPPHKNRWLRAEEYAALKDHVEPPEQTRAASAESVDWRWVIRTRECYTLILARFFTDPVIYFVIFWLPEYLRKERHFNLEDVGRYGWVPFLFGGIGYVLGGWLSGRLIRAGWSLPSARKAVMLMGAACMPVAILAPHAPNAWMAIGATCFLTFGHSFFTCNAQALPTDLFKGQEVGTATGFAGMGGAIGGMIANLGTGYLVQHFSYSPVFLLAGLMHPTAVILVYLLLPDRRFRLVQASGTS